MTKLNILQKLNLVMDKVKYIQKDKPDGMKYSIVSHDKVTSKVRPELVNAGVIYYPVNIHYEQMGNRTQVQLDLRFCNIDDKEDFIDVSCLGYGCDNQDKGPGKAVSYAVKYGLLKALGLETGDDPDQENINYKLDKISEVQIQKIESLIIESNADRENFLKYLGITSLNDLETGAYGNAIAALKRKKAS